MRRARRWIIFVLALATTAPAIAARWGEAGPDGAADEWTREESIEQAREELARIVGAPAEEIELVEARAVEWRDTSLGCPSKATVYQPATVPGYRIDFQVQGARYRVHVGRQQAVVCTTGYRQTSPLPKHDKSRLVLYRMAVESLCAELGVEVSRVTLLGISPREFADESLGCGAARDEAVEGAQEELPEAEATAPSIAGWVIQLAIGGETYRYHGAGDRVVQCPTPAAAADSEDGDSKR
jgi:hypothetical protein